MSGAGPELVPGEPPRIDRFRVAAEIGRGSTCVVYLAMDTRDGAWRALKVPAFERMGDERARARFRRECETALRVRHPHLARAVDADPEHPYTPWLALEVCEGGTLQDWLDQHGPMPAVLAIEVLVEICSALAAAHRAGVAQRRIELRDVLVDRNGKCRLVDFRAVPGTTSGLGSDSADLRDDIVAAGALLHTLVTGQKPAGATITASLPDPLKAVVRRALQRGRGKGYPDAASMGRDLEAAMLEVSLPATGTLPSLVSDDALLPATLEAVFDPSQTFPDLELAARWAVDPAAGPPKAEPGTGPLLARRTAAARPATPPPAPPPSPATPPEPSQRGALLPEALVEAAAAPFARATPAPSPFRSQPHGRLTTEDLRRRGEITPAPARRHVEAVGVPEYIVEEPGRPERSEAWRQATPKPVKRDVVPARPSGPDPRLVAAGVVLAFLLVIGTFAQGAWQVRDARALASDAGESLTALTTGAGSVVNELTRRGADRQALEDAFFAHSEARGDQRYVRAERFASLLLSEAGKVGLDPSAPVKDAVTQRVSEISDARARYVAAKEAWGEAASGFPGVLPVTFGLAKGPPR